MKRNMDLVRALLLQIEEMSAEELSESMAVAPIKPVGRLEDYTQNQIHYHMRLLHRADFIDASFHNPPSAPLGIERAKANRLTYQGHDLLDSIRDETVWERTKSRIQATTGTASVAVIKQVATQITQAMLT